MTLATCPPIDGDTRWVAIVADPISQVQSPQLFNAHFARRGINAVLLPAHVQPEHLCATLESLRHIQNLAGIVITVPHKIAATRFVQHLTPRARAIGSINCIRRANDANWEGDNFDGEGFVTGLLKQGHRIAGSCALLVGAAGGAGVSLAHALAQAGIARLDLHDIRRDALLETVDLLSSQYATAVFDASAEALPRHQFVINASPIGMRPEDGVPIDLSCSNPDAVIADLIMKPERTALLYDAQMRGLQTHPGRHLLENAVEKMAAFLRL
ncbi:shikimate dehydrogenase [Burkholderia sp. SCN-KJ]|uniref:shikimate dehydrogenase family protein n=1 Tax=Burkholderia sp. SCN-KJ TaxID=2969248 RepID=UPI00214F9EA1|nr:shikimate dehydrogenase [Burkholderia sp. SCN-KJ]MCR4467848.1 shikimate dehydrogenase [Burkholderia sp. SCN-KJ]